MLAERNTRNYFIEGLRFLFSVAVVVAHYKTSYDNELLAGKWNGHIAVEFFFVLSGVLMGAYCTKVSEQNDPVHRATWIFIRKKLAGIAPVYYCTLMIFVIEYVIGHNLTFDKLVEFISRLLPSILFLPSQGLEESCTITFSWYIGSMVVAMLVIFPLLYRWKKTFSLVVAPVLVLFYCQYAIQTYGKLFLLQQDWLGVCWPHLLRAGAEMCLGCTAFEAAVLLRARFSGRLTAAGRTLATLTSAGLLLLPFPWLVRGISGYSHPCVLLMFALGIAVTFSGVDNMGRLGEIKWIRTILAFLGQLSLALYLGQGIVIKFFPDHLPARPYGIYLYLMACFVVAVILFYGGKLLTLLGHGLFVFLTELCVSENNGLSASYREEKREHIKVPAEIREVTDMQSVVEEAEARSSETVYGCAKKEKIEVQTAAVHAQRIPPTGKSKITIRGICQTAAILLVLAFVLNSINGILMSKAGGSNVLAGQANPDASYDVIFAGSSHMNNAVYPMEIWEAHGYTSFNNAQSGEIIPVSYYTCKEAIEKYDPKILVLDVYMLYHKRADGSIIWMHQSLDHLSAANRIPAILDLVPKGELKEFLFPMTLYHSRWKELTKTDFEPTDTVRRGCAQNFTFAEDITGLSFEYQPPEVKTRPGDVPVEYLDKIVELCKKTDTQLVLVALPYFISSEVEGATHKLDNDQAYFNWVADYAEENGVEYINYFHLVDEIGFDWWQCLYNHSHMNYWGGTLITEHLGAWLAEHYDLPDHRGDAAYQHWNDDLQTYKKQVENNLKTASG